MCDRAPYIRLLDGRWLRSRVKTSGKDVKTLCPRRVVSSIGELRLRALLLLLSASQSILDKSLKTTKTRMRQACQEYVNATRMYSKLVSWRILVAQSESNMLKELGFLIWSQRGKLACQDMQLFETFRAVLEQDSKGFLTLWRGEEDDTVWRIAFLCESTQGCIQAEDLETETLELLWSIFEGLVCAEC